MLRDHRTTEQLEALVDRAGSGHPTREVERAKRELTLRQEPEEAAFQRKLTLSATVSVGGVEDSHQREAERLRLSAGYH